MQRSFQLSLLMSIAVLSAGVGGASCGRTGLGADDLEDDNQGRPPVDSGLDVALDVARTDTPPGGCTPTPEVCNGKDDDCNGLVDDLPPIPCPGGGARYCIAGRMSDCPTRCEMCIPGSTRSCFLSYCKYWGVQSCTADGRTFGYCKEDVPPPACKGIAETNKYSRELEQCCLDHGYCCRDEFDLNKNGITNENIGNCEGVSCK